jgi:hypothetical protein
MLKQSRNSRRFLKELLEKSPEATAWIIDSQRVKNIEKKALRV